MADGDTSRSLTPPGSSGWLGTLGWAAYLACSWTWCIGMFLPVLLVRDYEVWGFVVFAVPNVVGAAAMGWVLRDGKSEDIIRRHRAACATFSLVTIVFQVFFLFAFVNGGTAAALAERSVAGDFYGPPILLPILIAIAFAVGRGWGALACWGLSVACLVLWIKHEGAAGLPPAHVFEPSLVGLGPVCVFGFLLCPYLDLTFLHARRSTAQVSARWAFGLGFGVLFLTMILFTLAYSGVLAQPPTTNLGKLVLGVHITLQLAYTVVVHAIELARGRARWTAGIWLALGMVLAALVFGLIAMQTNGRISPQLSLTPFGLSLREIGYRLFMSFYGLIFPAYVYLCMIPTRDGHSGMSGREGKQKLFVLTGAIAIAAPMFWLGFIERQTVWLVPGLAVVLLSRVLVMGSKKRGGSVEVGSAV
jgi:hypothetical protein